MSDTSAIPREDLTTPSRPEGARPSGAPPYWRPGEQILWRYSGPTGQPEGTRPVTVVRDDADGLVVWLAPNTPILRPVHLDGRSIRVLPPAEAFATSWTLVRDMWQGTGILMIAPTGAPWSVWVVWPDSRFERKDEDELVGAVEAGRHSADEARILHAHLREAEAVVDSWGSPFCDGWERWRPDPTWPVPPLPQEESRWRRYSTSRSAPSGRPREMPVNPTPAPPAAPVSTGLASSTPIGVASIDRPDAEDVRIAAAAPSRESFTHQG